MLLTIVTVCLNCEDLIEKTIKSVLNQNFNDYEYLIVDGKSSDKTLTIVNNYKSDKLRVYSEKDNGIYDAMNKAAKLANGKYIYFLNAGDILDNKHVLSDVAKYLENDNDIYYGNIKKGSNIEFYNHDISLNYLILHEKMICHQAIFAKTQLVIDYPFDLKYKVCADREWLIRILKKDKELKYMSDILVADYDENGISSNYDKFSKESLEIAKKYKGSSAILIVKIKRIIGKVLKRRQK